MTKQEAIRETCSIIALAYHSIGDYSEPSDGFCDKCEKLHGILWNYQNSGKTIQYVREAVLKALKADGHKVVAGFDPITGKEIKGQKGCAVKSGNIS